MKPKTWMLLIGGSIATVLLVNFVKTHEPIDLLVMAFVFISLVGLFVFYVVANNASNP